MKAKWLVAGMPAITMLAWVAAAIPAAAQAAPVSQAQGEQIVTLKIEGWTCASCERYIRRALLAVPGVKALNVSYARGGAIMTVEPGRVTPEQLVRAVEQASTAISTYRAVVVPNGSLSEAPAEAKGESWLRKLFQ